MDMNWPSSQPVSSAARASLKQLQSAIAVATGLASAGRAIDLAGLESVAGLLCAQVLDLPPQDGRGLRAELVALDESIAGLSATLAATLAIPDP